MDTDTKESAEDTRLNDNQNPYKKGSSINDAKKAEQQSTFDSMVDPENYSKDGKSGDLSGGVKKAEEEPSYINNVKETAKDLSKATMVKVPFLKKKGPMGALIGLLLAGVFGIGTFFGPASLLINLKENLITKFDYGNTTATTRADRILAKKLSGEYTSGVCNGGMVKIACRYTRPSNSLLNKLSKEGIVTYNKAGDIINPKKIGFNEIPARYEYPDGKGGMKSVNASEFSKELRSSAKFRAAIHRANNPRWLTLASDKSRSILSKFGVTLKNSLSNSNTPEAIKEDINKRSAGTTNTVSAVADDTAEASQSLKKLLNEKFEQSLIKSGKKASKSGGDPFLLAGTAACIVLDIPGFVSGVVRGYQLIQLIKYGMLFMTAADAIQAGEATPEQVAVLGVLLTSVYKDVKGNIVSNSAMDSFGVKYALFGDTRTTGFKSNFNKFMPGGGISAALGPVANVTSSPAVKQSCSLIYSPQAQVAVNSIEAAVSAASLGTGAIVIGALKAVGKGVLLLGAIDQGIKLLINSGLIGEVIDKIPIDKVLGFFLGDLTQDIVGEDVGNAMTSGVANSFDQINAGNGNAPLTKEQALAYDNYSNSVKLAYAEEDRATLSPFDTSNPNTFLGSIATKIIPYYSSFFNVSGSMSIMGNIFNTSLGSFGEMFGVRAADPSNEFDLCEDTLITGSGVAAGPFCNVVRGIPVEYLSADPDTVLSAVSSQINDETGEPLEGSDLAEWVTDCGSGEVEGIGGCIIDNQETANYALYTVDHGLQMGIDDDFPVEPTTTAGTNSGDVSLPTGSSTELAQQIIATGNISDRTGQINITSKGGTPYSGAVNPKTLSVILKLAQESNKFTISSMARDFIPSNGSSTSWHLSGRAADISGSATINGSALGSGTWTTGYGYNIGTKPEIINFAIRLTQILPDNCQIGLPNNDYINAVKSYLRPGCSIFLDRGSGPHIHFGVPA